MTESKLRDVVRRGYFIDKKGVLYNPKKEIIKGYLNRGYRETSFRFEGEEGARTVRFHKLQAFQKYGRDSLVKGIHVRHLDGDKSNNNWDNIAIGSPSDNMMDIPKEDRILNASNPIYNHKDILEDRNSGMTYSELMRKYNILSKGTISFIVNNSLKSKGVI